MSIESNLATEYSMGNAGFQLVTSTALTTGPFVAITTIAVTTLLRSPVMESAALGPQWLSPLALRFLGRLRASRFPVVRWSRSTESSAPNRDTRSWNTIGFEWVWRKRHARRSADRAPGSIAGRRVLRTARGWNWEDRVVFWHLRSNGN